MDKRTRTCKQCKRDIVISTDKTYYHCAEHKLYEETMELIRQLHKELNWIEERIDFPQYVPLDHFHFKLTSLLKYLSNLNRGWVVK
jgi:hypothetical protein